MKISEPESYKRVLEIEVPKDEVEGLYNEKINTYKKKLTLPGFRPGKIPLSLVKSRFGKGVYAETVEDLIQKNFELACKEHNINPVNKGKIDAIKADEGTDVSFTIEAEVDPEIEITGYEKLKIKASLNKIKDEDVEKALEDLRERNAKFIDVDRPSRKGDSVTIEYVKVVVDGEERKDFKNPAYPIELGKGQIKDFDKGLIGHNAGELVELTIKFPKDFSGEQLSGKVGNFTIKITKVSEKELPEPDGEFLKKLGTFETLDGLKEQLRKDLERQDLERAKNEAYNRAIDVLIKDNPFDIPPSRVEDYIDHLLEEAARYRRVNEPAPSREEAARKYHDSAVRALKRYRIIEFISSKEKIKATQEEVDGEIGKIAAMYNQPFDQVKQAFRQNGTTNRVRADLREQKTLDFLIGEYTPAAE
ncbi:MAG: trigger factor [Chitinivibrionales bacterium]